jgi:DNA polymerase III alpha subunit (gram-positive type)
MFNHDLLILDIEATGTDVTKHEIIQLAAILLDKKTLKEKAQFSSYIKPRHWKNRMPAAMEVNGITWEQLKKAPSMRSVLQKFTKQFGTNILPTTYGGNLDIVFLPSAYRQAGLKFPFDYHTFNIWALCYTYMAKRKKLTNKKRFAGFRLEEIARDLKVEVPENRHDALVDCQFEAAVLRKLVKALKV